MNTATARKLKDLHNLSRLWEKEPSKRETIEKNYTYQLNQLMSSEWRYALGRENEIPKDNISPSYNHQKELLLIHLEQDLIEHKSTMRNTEERSIARNLAFQNYYDVFAEMTWINGNIYMLDVFSEITDELMPTAYIKHWPNMERTEKQKKVKEIYFIRKNFFNNNEKETTLINKVNYINKLNELLDNDWDYAFNHDMELPREDMPERYLKHKANVFERIENDMNALAKQYPSVKDNDAEAHHVILSYYDKFSQLLYLNGGIEGLNLKETLPLEKMPKVYRYNQEINHALSQSRGR